MRCNVTLFGGGFAKLSQAKERKDHGHDNNEPNQINNAVHHSSSRCCNDLKTFPER